MFRSILVVSALAGLASCGGTAPPPGSRTAAFETDREACATAVPEAVDKRNAKTGLAWLASPVTRWGAIADGKAACMDTKGWGRTRACTPAELAAGDRSPNLAVTAAGVRCTDPAAR